MLTVWGRKNSSNVQALMWCIGEMGLAYKRIDIGHKYGGNDTPEFLAMNPNGTVPVLQDGQSDYLWETGAILRYLSGRYGNSHFWPAELGLRTQVDMWAEWSKLNITLNFSGPIFWQVIRTAPQDRQSEKIAEAIKVLTHKLTIAERRLEQHRFMVGDYFTLADIQFGHLLYRYFDIDIERPNLPCLKKYYDNLCQRSAYKEHVMVSYEDLKVTL
ncbi:glutathione S-transferase family protein [Budvicia diplopodorum]|uniref:glutathione S-transferase family protein n=1 Tax=Budvicia diplopodorum TaxID=1119056 RepID=UPI00135686A0|nr:glutathione S-transferase family protein [Budvicia diplopodorum]